MQRLLRSTAAALAGLACAACTTAYVPYAVEQTPAPHTQFETLPVVNSTPTATAGEYRVYQAASGPDLYVVPTGLALEVSRMKADAISLERHDGGHQILVAWVRPRSLDIQHVAESFPGRRVRYYPVDRLTIRTLTSTQDPSVLRVTATREPAAASPFAVLVAIQSFGRRNIRDLKALLQMPSGYLLEARFVIQTVDRGQVEIAIPINFGNVTVTEQTL